jgi:hypothetical protein
MIADIVFDLKRKKKEEKQEKKKNKQTTWNIEYE